MLFPLFLLVPPPPVFEPATIDSDNQVRLSWSEPDRTCCVNFLVMASDRPSVTVNQPEYRISNLPLNTELNATVRCLTGNNFEGSLSQPQISLNSELVNLYIFVFKLSVNPQMRFTALLCPSVIFTIVSGVN